MIQLDESKKTKLIKQNVINIRLQIGGYYTAKLRSAIRLIIAALGSFENCGNVAVSRPIVVYEKYNPESKYIILSDFRVFIFIYTENLISFIS